MKIIRSIKSGVSRALNAWKGAMIIWFVSLILISLLAIQLRSMLNAGLGKSMITEKLINGVDMDVLSDLGKTMSSMIASFTSGLFLLILTGIVLNAFLTGGLFDTLKENSPKLSGRSFFRASAENFWAFLVITLIISLIILIIFILLIVVPLSVVANSDIRAEGAMMKTGLIVVPVFFLLVSILLLVADYSRAWKVSLAGKGCFSALGFGFSHSFRTFFSSFPLMIIILIFQGLFGWAVIKILTWLKPVTGGGVFLLFIVSQFLFFFKIILKVIRYGSVTSLMEQNSNDKPVHSDMPLAQQQD